MSSDVTIMLFVVF